MVVQKESGAETYPSWYPPVQHTLMCLSKLYRCVEARVFAGLAQDAVTSCTAAVQVGLLLPAARFWDFRRRLHRCSVFLGPRLTRFLSFSCAE